MLCYRCGSHNPEGTDVCSHCGQPLTSGVRANTSTGTLRVKAAAPDDAPFPLGTLIAERYELKEFLGAGPVGWVYRVEDKDVGGEMALKLIRPKLVQTEEERKAFRAALKGGRQFSHPQLARVYEDGLHGEYLFFTQPHLGGRTLRSVLDVRHDAGQNFSLREALPLLAQVSTALTAAHAVGVHGDVKPENIFVLPDALKLTDFGLAVGIPREPFLRAQQQFQRHAYFSPEYVAGADIDARADVYAFGVLVGELLGNVVPEGSIPSLRHANPDLPLAVNGLYRRALNESRDARPETVAVLLEELTQLADNLEKASFDFPPAPSPGGRLLSLEGGREPLPPPVPTPEPMAALEPRRQSSQDVPDLSAALGPEDEDSLPLVPPGMTPVHRPLEAGPGEERPGAERRATAQWPRSDVPTIERPLSPPMRANGGELRRRHGRRSHSLAVLLWIAIAGLGVGIAAGVVILDRVRNRMLPAVPLETVGGAGAMSPEPGRGATNRAPPRGPPGEALPPAPEDDRSGEPSGRTALTPQGAHATRAPAPVGDSAEDGASTRDSEETLARALSMPPATPGASGIGSEDGSRAAGNAGAHPAP